MGWSGRGGSTQHGASGFASIADPATTVTVEHHSPDHPERSWFQVTPTSDLGAATRFWIADVTATHFTIAVDQAPGAGGPAEFVWLWTPGRIPDPGYAGALATTGYGGGYE